MIGSLIKREAAKMGRRYDYDTGYLSEFIDADETGGLKLGLATLFFNHRTEVPKPAYWAAKLRATMTADCGSCLRLVIAMAREDGVELETLRAVCAGRGGNTDAALAAAYADAVLGNGLELAELTARVRDRFGAKGLASLATAIVAGQFYPTFKRALGHGNACEPVLRDLEAGTLR